MTYSRKITSLPEDEREALNILMEQLLSVQEETERKLNEIERRMEE